MKILNGLARKDEVNIGLKDVQLEGFLSIPKNPKGIVIFAHGSGSSRFSQRNRAVADYLFRKHIGTLLFDLLTEEEEKIDRSSDVYRFNIAFLSERLVEVTDWMSNKFETENRSVPVGFFGASTGGAAAIDAAVRRSGTVKAIVSRGGRPDMAVDLAKVKAATLLIVGGDDFEVLKLNREAYDQIRAPKDLYIVKGATHLFEEPGALEEVANVSAHWFERYFQGEKPITNK